MTLRSITLSFVTLRSTITTIRSMSVDFWRKKLTNYTLGTPTPPLLHPYSKTLLWEVYLFYLFKTVKNEILCPSLNVKKLFFYELYRNFWVIETNVSLIIKMYMLHSFMYIDIFLMCKHTVRIRFLRIYTYIK